MKIVCTASCIYPRNDGSTNHYVLVAVFRDFHIFCSAVIKVTDVENLGRPRISLDPLIPIVILEMGSFKAILDGGKPILIVELKFFPLGFGHIAVRIVEIVLDPSGRDPMRLRSSVTVTSYV